MSDSIETLILKALKSSRGCTIRHLERLLPDNYRYTDYDISYFITDPIIKLAKWGLIEVYDQKGKLVNISEMHRYNIPDGNYFLSPVAAEMETTLGFSFTENSKAIFGDPKVSSGYPQLFMLMPFLPGMRPVFDDHIRKVAKGMGFSSARADDFFSTGSIMKEIWSAIFNALIIVADCTGRNPNVFYEIGIAHTLGKNTILISQHIDDVPFDLRHLRVITYQYTPRGMTEFEEKFAQVLNEISNQPFSNAQ